MSQSNTKFDFQVWTGPELWMMWTILMTSCTLATWTDIWTKVGQFYISCMSQVRTDHESWPFFSSFYIS